MKLKNKIFSNKEVEKIQKVLKHTLNNIKLNEDKKNYNSLPNKKSNLYSNRIIYKNNLYNNNKLKHIKNNRSFSSQNFSNLIKNKQINKFYNENQFEEATFQEMQNKFKKMKLRAKFVKLVQNSIILQKSQVLLYNYMFKKNNNNNESSSSSSESEKQNNNNNNKRMIITKQSNYFSIINNSNRYEDVYKTPYEFIKKNFTFEEQRMLISDPKYFFLNRPPFKGIEIKLMYNLSDKINEEEKNKKKKIIKLSKNIKLFKNNKENNKENNNNNNKKIKFNFSLSSFDNNNENNQIFSYSNRNNYNKNFRPASTRNKNCTNLKLNLKPLLSINSLEDKNYFKIYSPKKLISTNNILTPVSTTNFSNSIKNSSLNNQKISFNSFFKSDKKIIKKNYETKFKEFNERRQNYLNDKQYLINKKHYFYDKLKNKHTEKINQNKEDIYKISHIVRHLQKIFLNKKKTMKYLNNLNKNNKK